MANPKLRLGFREPEVDTNRPFVEGSVKVEGFDLRWPMQAIWLRPYLRRVAGIVLLSAITLTLVDFLFKSTVATLIPPSQLGSFFATTYLVLNSLSLVAQLLAVSWARVASD